jgi:hypothetical protein
MASDILTTTWTGVAVRGFLNRLRLVPEQREPQRVVGLMVDIAVHGESFHAEHIRKLLRKYGRGDFEIILVAEPANPYDSNAVAVHADGGLAGHLPRKVAPAWQPMILAANSEGFIVAGTASIWGGTKGKENLGIFGSAPWFGAGPPPGR